MRILLLFVLGLSCVCADDVTIGYPIPQTVTTSLSGNRYEMIQSSSFARATYKLDKWTGVTWLLVTRKDGNPAWQAVVFDKPPKNMKPQDNHFQILISGLGLMFTYLLDTESGESWQMLVDKEGSQRWVHMDHLGIEP